MRKLIFIITILSGSLFLAQTGNVGINTSSPNPNAVLDVVSADRGLLPPRISLTSTLSPSPLTAHVAGMIVYNIATTGDVTPALYYNDGTKWILSRGNTVAATTHTLSVSGNTITSDVNGVAPSAAIITSNTLTKPGVNTIESTVNGITSSPATIISSVSNVSNLTGGNTLSTMVNGITGSDVVIPNIYTANGTLTGNRIVTTAGFPLTFSNGTSSTMINNTAANGSLTVRGSSRAAINAIAGSNSNINIFVDDSSVAQYLAGGSITAMVVGTGTSSAAPLRLITDGATRMTISGTTGNIGIGVNPTANKLEVGGSVKATNFISSTTTYPDYVFEDYYKGNSEINPQYKFRKLEEIEGFIKENGHLPGYASIEEIKKKEMTIDVSKNTMTNMEKIEELYLYAIEQNKMVKELQDEIKILKKKVK